MATGISTSLPTRTSPGTLQPPIQLPPSASVTDYEPILASWSRAIDLFNSRLTKDEKKRIDPKKCQHASFPELLATATAVKEKAEQARYPWTGKLQKTFQQINRYAAVGDVMIQHHAEYTALVWGAFRFLLLATVGERVTSEKLSDALENSVQIIFRAEEYAKLFSTHSRSSTERVFQTLQENLTCLYAEILNFLVRATKFFQTSTLKRYVAASLSPFDTRFRDILDRVDRYERNVEKDKALLESEAWKSEKEYQNGVWLKHADFMIDIQKLRETHVADTCQWFLTGDTYLNWKTSSTASPASNLLWIQGKAGSGKSTIASQIVQDLQSVQGAIVVSIFCKSAEENKSNVASILRNLIFQILEKSCRRKAFHQLVSATRIQEKSVYAQSNTTLWRLLRDMLKGCDFVYCVLDGLDECNDPRRELGPSETGNQASLWGCLRIQSSDIRGDIEMVATTKIQNSRVLNLHPDKKHLLQALVDDSDGMILWAVLMINELEVGHWDVRSVLQKPPQGLVEVYATILCRISKTKATIMKVQRALQLILVAARPLRLEELAQGVAVIEGLSQHEHYDQRGNAISEAENIILESSPLLTVMQDSTVQLAHSSLKDYLLGKDLQSSFTALCFDEPYMQKQMTLSLITYMAFRCFCADLKEQLQVKYYLLEYASKWLVHHVTRTAQAHEVAKVLIQFFETTQGWKWLERLSAAYRISPGHLQLMQSNLKVWTGLLHIIDGSHLALSNFLLVLAQNRVRELSLSLSNEHPDTLSSMAYLASTYQNQGRWKEAENLEVQVMNTSKRVLGDEHPDTLSSMANLAITYWNQGRWKEAEDLEVQVMDMSKRVLGDEHPDTLTSMANLAATYQKQGRWKEAEDLEMQVMDTRKRVLGDEHPDTLTSMANLASTYQKQGRLKEAEDLEVQVMDTRRRVLGDEHPDTLSSMANSRTLE
ncbi:MAG: hypothetical protein M1812_005836 [Candelaria pacifica]|nr:MAG: hypothetical protein M1812_005836 [Candelaria pacifica]